MIMELAKEGDVCMEVERMCCRFKGFQSPGGRQLRKLKKGTKLERDIFESCDTLPLSLVQHRLLPHKPVLRSLVLLVSKLQKELMIW